MTGAGMDRYMFDRMATGEYANTQFVITASYLEIINGSLRDLLPGGSHGKLKLATSVDGRTHVAVRCGCWKMCRLDG